MSGRLVCGPNVVLSHFPVKSQRLSCHVGTPTFIDSALNPSQSGRLDSVKGATMATVISTKNNRKLILTSAAVFAVGVGAYGLGRVYPPLGPSQGTVGPAQRYVSSPGRRRRRNARRHLGSGADADRRLPGVGQGPELPPARKRSQFLCAREQFGGDVGDCGQPDRILRAAQNPANFHQLVQQASALSAASSNVSSASALSVMAQNSAAFSKLSQFPGAFAAMSGHHRPSPRSPAIRRPSP